jgi:ubiquinone/menaquinone biosynthesis C-methylase UbiE
MRNPGSTALEVGIGTGKNIAHYPQGIKITAIDISRPMLKRAKRWAKKLGFNVDLCEMDAQRLGFADQSFDLIFATFVFCSVPDPVMGLRELRRICRPNGKLLLLEHMRPGNPFLGIVFDILNPFVVRMVGANINRRTVESIKKAGWYISREERVLSDVVHWIEAFPRA